MRLQMAIAVVALIFPARAAFAHGTVGDYTFLEPIVADDANPKNEFDILRPAFVRTADGHEFSLGSSLEKVLVTAPESYPWGAGGGNLASIEIGNEWIYDKPRGENSQSGFGQLELMAKVAFLTIPEHEFRLSLGLNLLLPAGSPSVEQQQHTQLGPMFLWAKGFGDLPNSSLVKYLRPFGIQGDYGYIPAVGGRTWHEMFADNVIEYSLPYLSSSVRDIGLKWPLRNMYLYTEFNYDQLITGPSGQTFPQILATPGVAYMDYYFELSLATQFALNHATVPNNHAAVLGLIDLFIDDIFPWTNRTLF